jgi:hypothetical protein
MQDTKKCKTRINLEVLLPGLRNTVAALHPGFVDPDSDTAPEGMALSEGAYHVADAITLLEDPGVQAAAQAFLDRQ